MKGVKRTYQKTLACLLAAAVFLTSGTTARGAAADAANTEETAGEIKNPVYDVSSDSAEWSYVYFGSYPQTEVTGEDLKPRIVNASYDSNGDAEAMSNKYRRVVSSDADGGYRYFKWEKIRWRVLQKSENTLFVMADTGLDCKPYHESYSSVTWYSCDLRDWLNADFYDAAFDGNEKNAIVSQSVVNNSGNNTQDKVYLLSTDEATNSEYGYCGSSYSSASRQYYATDYARAKGASNNGEASNNAPNAWWLRSSGYYTNYQAVDVASAGQINDYGVNVNSSSCICVPVLHINLASDAWSITDDQNTDKDTSQNPVYDVETDTTRWNYYEFGSYPQTEVTGADLTSAIINASYDENGDAETDGEKYRRISAEDTNNGENFGAESEYRYFKWEPVKWRILEKEGSILYLLADAGLDCKNYNASNSSSTAFSGSSIRNWLNQTFYQEAFTTTERKAVVPAASGENVFLLAEEEAVFSPYGFSGDGKQTSNSRRMRASGYACAMGAYSADTAGQEEKNCWWWLSSENDSEDGSPRVYNDGEMDRVASATPYGAVVPALFVNLDQEEEPSNPKYNAVWDSADVSYVYFGSYPQTEVSGEELTDAVTGAYYNENGDANVGGVKYRRIKGGEEGKEAYHYFKWEKIKWRVLNKNGEQMTVLADLALDCMDYSDETSGAWEMSSLYQWLNGTFYNAAFTKKEKRGMHGQVSLLSEEDAIKTEYGFRGNSSASVTRQLLASDYAKASGASVSEGASESCAWWLLGKDDSGNCLSYAANVSRYGGLVSLTSWGIDVSEADPGIACVPLLCLDTASAAWSLEEEGNPDPDKAFLPKYDEASGTAEWKYVYFGSYPQTEVAGDDLSEAITGAEYDDNGDTEVSGDKYRRICAEDTNNNEHFGTESEYRYFKWEPVKWRILEKDGSMLYLLADVGLDCQTYHSFGNAVSFQNSELFGWLNRNFYEAAFTAGERRSIVPKSGTENISLLSAEEVTDMEYGFGRNGEDASVSRRMRPSDYAYVKGAFSLNDSEGETDCWWWLSSQEAVKEAPRVYNDGTVDKMLASTAYGAVVPALVICPEQTMGPANPKYSALSDKTDWDFVYFGSYPQTEVLATGALINAKYNENGDAEVGGETYRRIGSGDTTDASHFGSENAYRYFKWEPLKWRVLQNDGNELFLMADTGLDCRRYHGIAESVAWEDSALQSWLNETFYRTAFTETEREAVSDGVSLLSADEAYSVSYGFSSRAAQTKSRQVGLSDYAYVMGAQAGTGALDYVTGAQEGTEDSVSVKDACCGWWTGLQTSMSSNARYVDYAGTVFYGDTVTNTRKAVVPVLRVSLASNLWRADDENGGITGAGWPFTLGGLEDQEANEEDSVTFEIEVQSENASSVTFQWYLDGKAVDGATSCRYVVERIGDLLPEPSDETGSHIFYCEVRSGNRTVKSNEARLTVHHAVVRKKHAVVFETNGGSAVAPVEVTDGETLDEPETAKEGYDFLGWFTDSACVTPYEFDEAVKSDMTLYAGWKESFRLGVLEDMEKNEADSVRLEIEIIGAQKDDCSYQWYVGGKALDGATTNPYDIEKIGERLPGTSAETSTYVFYCKVRNGEKTLDSNKSYLTVHYDAALAKHTVTFETNGGSAVAPVEVTDGETLDEPETAKEGYEFLGWFSDIACSKPYGFTQGVAKDMTLYAGWKKTPSDENTTGGNTSGGGNMPGGSTPGGASNPPAQAEAPLAPSVAIKLSSPTSVKLSWKKVSGASGYQVYRASSKNGKYKKIKTLSKTSFTDKKLKRGKAYYYKVKAYKGSRSGAYSKAVSKKTPPKKIAATKFTKRPYINVSKKTVTFSWKLVKNAHKIVIQRRVDGGKYKDWKVISAKNSKATFSYKGFAKNHTYEFGIYAYFKDGKVKVSGKPSRQGYGIRIR